MLATATSLCKTLQDKGYIAVFAGGCVRDMLRGKEAKDVDIATNALPEQIENIFQKTYAIGKKFGVILIEENCQHFEVATFRSDSGYSDGRRPDAVFFTTMEEDALRRDFTINALFWDPIKKRLYDFVRGKDDIKKKILRFVGKPEKRIEEDYLRILRAIRFKNTLGYTYATSIPNALSKLSGRMLQVSPERIKEEIEKIFHHKNSHNAFIEMEQFGILQLLFPHIAKLRQVPDAYGKKDVLEHTLQALSFLRKRTSLLSWSILFHDLGKLDTLTHTDRNHYPDHQNISAAKSLMISNFLQHSRSEKKAIFWLVKNHIRFYDTLKMTRIHQLHFFDHPLFLDLIELCWADAKASDGDTKLVESIAKAYQKAHKKKELPQFTPELLNGNEIMNATGLSSGKIIGTIKKELREKQMHGKIITKQEAKNWVCKIYSSSINSNTNSH